MIRKNRKADELREIIITKNFMKNATGSVLIEAGNTRVLCSAMFEPGVPPFLMDKQRGWLTAGYAMLPASTPVRKKRETIMPDGRSMEIKRLIGRALRSVMDFHVLGENTIHIDCDVIEADGGTRTASITGGFIALMLAVNKLVRKKIIIRSPVTDYVAAVSAGLVEDKPLLDLCYAEDSNAQADMNIVMCEKGGIIEVQCAGEKRPITQAEFHSLFALGEKGIKQIIEIQKKSLGSLTELIGG